MGGTHLELTCMECDAREVLGMNEIPQRLAKLQMLRRADKPDDRLWMELLHHAAPRLACRECGAIGIDVRPYHSSRQDEWEADRQCAVCQAAIASERVELFPDVTLCVACQSAEETGNNEMESEYCPRCGAVLEVRTSSTGISRYVLRCPACRWRS